LKLQSEGINDGRERIANIKVHMWKERSTEKDSEARERYECTKDVTVRPRSPIVIVCKIKVQNGREVNDVNGARALSMTFKSICRSSLQESLREQ